MDITKIAVIILAAGKGTRMKSELPKVLHKINGQSMINLVLSCASSIFDKKNIIVVVGHKSELVKEEINSRFEVFYALQERLIGTGDAVRSAIPFLQSDINHVVILCGDVPLIKRDTILNFAHYHVKNNHDISLLGVTVEQPKGYGRLIFNEHNKLTAICEEADATAEEKKINTVNSGIYCIKKEFLIYALDLIDTDNVQNEYYLTDLVSIASRQKSSIGCFIGNNPSEVIGVNTVEELEKAEQMLNKLS
ncbi:MAG: NTP transferase domain-containing protein [Desulfamplus sp.]|nr:NTP transferase domain-containing protein [Desulfamplus sp.]